MSSHFPEHRVARSKPKVQTVGRDDRAAAPPRELLQLEQVLGQSRAIDQLRAAVSAGRIHHAWIFHGPMGVGKFTTAAAFAALLLDPEVAPDLSGVLRADPESQVQRLVRAGSHPDLHVVTKELAAVSEDATIRDRKQSNIPKAVLREFLLEPAAKTRVMTGASAAAKVFIVDEAELIDATGQNSLLKMLEEPPAGSVIILVTASEERLLPTIRSRCQRIAFGPLDASSMEQWLARRAPELAAAQREWLLRFAAGSPGVAAMVLENDLFAWREALDPALAKIDAGAFPIEMGATLADLVDERAAAWVKRHPDASKDAANKAWARRMFGFLAEHFRAQLADPAHSLRAAACIHTIASAEQQLGANVNLALVMENLAAQLSLGGNAAAVEAAS